MYVALDPHIEVAPADLATAWNAHNDTDIFGVADVVNNTVRDFTAGVLVLELVAIPLTVNIASNIAYELVRKLISNLRHDPKDNSALEFIEVVIDDGNLVVIVRIEKKAS